MTGLRDDELDISRLRSASMNRWKTPRVVQHPPHAPHKPTDREASQRTKPPKPSLELDRNDQDAHNFTVKRCRETSQSIKEPTPPLNHRQRTPEKANAKMAGKAFALREHVFWKLLESQELFPPVCERGPFFEEKALEEGKREKKDVVGV